MSDTQGYYVPHGSSWPAIGTIGLLLLTTGVATALNGSGAGPIVAWAGVAVMMVMMFGWFSVVVG
jgi:cytochrome c oxidase subunit 3